MKPMKYPKLAVRILNNKLAKTGLTKPSLFRMDISVTNACDSRCNYCKIWEIYIKKPQEARNELKLEEYRKLFEQIDASWLHITGGEPFLKREISEIISLADEKMNPLLIDMPTNGFLTEHILGKVRDILEKINCKFVIGVSIDGPEEIHEKSRGVENGWEKTFGTFLRLREMKNEFTNFDVHINHFINPMNLGTADRLLEKVKEFGVRMDEISIEVARNSPFFVNEDIPIASDNGIIIEELEKILGLYKQSRFSFRRLLREIYTKEMIHYIQTGKRKIPCGAGFASVHIDPYGNVYGCSQLKIAVGSIRLNAMQEILDGATMKKWRDTYSYKCERCLSGCEGVTSIVQDMPNSLLKHQFTT